jgi:hypothetical protein
MISWKKHLSNYDKGWNGWKCFKNAQILKVNWIVIKVQQFWNLRFGNMDAIGRGFVTTLTLGSQPRQKLAKVQAKSETQELHFMLLEV